MKDHTLYPMALLAVMACTLGAPPVAAQQARQAAPVPVATTPTAAAPQQPAQQTGIIVVGGKPDQDANPPVRVADKVGLNPQPLPPRQPDPPPDPHSATQTVTPADSAGKAGIIVVVASPGSRRSIMWRPLPFRHRAINGKQLRKTGDEGISGLLSFGKSRPGSPGMEIAACK
jgi:hypothetical protein